MCKYINKSFCKLGVSFLVTLLALNVIFQVDIFLRNYKTQNFAYFSVNIDEFSVFAISNHKN